MKSNASRRKFLKGVAVATVAGSTAAAPAMAQSSISASAIAQSVHSGVNEERRSRGLSALSWHSGLAADAQTYSRRMAEEDFFSHTAPGESSFSDHYSVNCSSLGENILYRTMRADSAEAVAANIVEQWMNSQGHRENILGDWQSEGVGVYITADGTAYATQAFGSCETPSRTETPQETETPTRTPTRTPTETPRSPDEETDTPRRDDRDEEEWWDDDDRNWRDDSPDDSGWWDGFWVNVWKR